MSTRSAEGGVQRAPATHAELRARLTALAASAQQKACLRWVDKVLEPFPERAQLEFWVLPRPSLRGHTPLQAFADGHAHRVQEAAEAFADA